MLSNPLIRRYRYSLMRPAQFWVYVIIYISILALVIFINSSLFKSQDTYENITSLYKSLFFQLLLIESIMLIIWGAINSSSVIKQERVERTYDFFKILPLPAYKKMLGVLIGKNLVVLLLSFINLLFLTFFAFSAKLDFVLQAQVLFILVSITLLSNTTGLLTSLCGSAKKSKGAKIAGILFLLFFGMPLLINGFAALTLVENYREKTLGFYNIELPCLILVSLIALYYTAWNVVGLLRKFNKDSEPLFSRLGAILFVIGYQVVTIGLLIPHTDKIYFSAIEASYWWLTLAPILVVPLASIYNMQHYLEFRPTAKSKNRPTGSTTIGFLSRTNVILCLLLFALWSAGTLIFNAQPDVNLAQPVLTIVTLATFFIFLVLMLELAVTYEPAQGKITLLLVVVVVFYCILPPILTGIFESEILYMFSPAGFLTARSSEEFIEPAILRCIWLINLLLSVIPATLIIKRYAQIIHTKTSLLTNTGDAPE